jgi:hypothetical protein
MGFIRAIFGAGPSAEREQQRRLREARLLLVEHACHLEYYRHSVAMLTERIARIESASAPHSPAQRAGIVYTDAGDAGDERKSATQIPQFTSPSTLQRHVNGAT